MSFEHRQETGIEPFEVHDIQLILGPFQTLVIGLGQEMGLEKLG